MITGIKDVTFKIDEEEWTLFEIEVKYLYSYFFRFDNRYSTSLLELGITILSGDNLSAFKHCFSQALSDLLLDCYVEPSIRKRQKYPTSYEKFKFAGEKYVVDYRTSMLGRLIYALYTRLIFTEKAIELEKELIIIKS